MSKEYTGQNAGAESMRDLITYLREGCDTCGGEKKCDKDCTCDKCMKAKEQVAEASDIGDNESVGDTEDEIAAKKAAAVENDGV